ncbi:VOC family protein [Streptomyces varsoviensis]|uniref:VOC family protein n=1 Tax=Streptomyces varsoviensis TaxID=67373 RepID=UPI0033D5754D
MAAFADGEPCWADVALPDLEAGKRFYGELFGWTFGVSSPEFHHYTQALRDDKAVAGLMPKPDGRMPTAWGVFFATSDTPGTAARIREAGGQVIEEAVVVGDLGTMGLAVDPGGAFFGTWQGAAHKGFGLRHEPGSFGWVECWTRDAKAVDPFYEAVFGYGSVDFSDNDAGLDFVVWTPAGQPADAEHAALGRAVIDDTFPAELPAHFLIYFMVEDCDAAVRTTTRLGGRVVRDPQDSPYGRFAVLVDDQGASFAVIDSSTTA